MYKYGIIGKALRVICGECKQNYEDTEYWEDWPIGDFEDYLRSSLWTKNAKFGWTCGDCNGKRPPPPNRTIPPWKNGPDFNNYRFESNGKLIDRKVVSEVNGFPVADYIDANTGESLNLTTEEMIVLPVGVWKQLEADPPQ